MTINSNDQIRLTNNFGKYNDVVLKFIKTLYTNSVLLYDKQYQGRNRTNTQDFDKQKIRDSINYVVDYLYYYYNFYKEDFYDIFMQLIKELKYVTVLKPGDRGIYGMYESLEKCLYINPEMKSSSNLNSNARIRLYINHELGHVINSRWMWLIEQYLNITSIPRKYSKQLIYDGFSLLDEATTQNRAEDITYYYLGKNRPNKNNCRSMLFRGVSYQTNYDYYGEMQTPATVFARTLRGIGHITNDDLALKKLCDRALKYDFSSDIVYEYEQDGQLDNLYNLFQNLGIIKNASYAAFGMADKKYLSQSLPALNNFILLATKLRDRRPPLLKKVK